MTLGAAAEPAFPGHIDGETVLLLTRRHPIHFVLSIFFPVLLVLGSLAAIGMLATQASDRVEFWTGWFLVPLGGLAIASLWILAMQQEWANDRFIVTDRRAIAWKRIYKFMENRKEVDLYKLQDLTVNIGSVVAHLFGYGDVVIATAATGGGLVLRAVPDPERVKELVFEAGRVLREETHTEERRVMRERLAQELAPQRRGVV